MKNPMRDWLRRHTSPDGKSFPREDERGSGVEHLRVGQSLVRDDMAQDSISLILQGCCESEHPREAAPLRAGDAIDGARGARLNMRAIVDSDILRLPRQNIRRLLERWPAMLRSGAPSSLQAARPPAKKKGYGKILCLMPLSDGIPCEEFSSICAETIAKETAEDVLCIKVDKMAPASDGSLAFRHLTRVFKMSSFSTPMAEAIRRSLQDAFETAGSGKGAIFLCDRRGASPNHGGSADRDHPAKLVRLSHSSAERGESFRAQSSRPRSAGPRLRSDSDQASGFSGPRGECTRLELLHRGNGQMAGS